MWNSNCFKDSRPSSHVLPKHVQSGEFIYFSRKMNINFFEQGFRDNFCKFNFRINHLNPLRIFILIFRNTLSVL
ncbi:hypothetical protein AO269_31070 [Pseudomonas putida]|nr:hypothetical protein AO269_31070 [Pseudomonas putida]